MHMRRAGTLAAAAAQATPSASPCIHNHPCMGSWYPAAPAACENMKQQQNETLTPARQVVTAMHRVNSTPLQSSYAVACAHALQHMCFPAGTRTQQTVPCAALCACAIYPQAAHLSCAKCARTLCAGIISAGTPCNYHKAVCSSCRCTLCCRTLC